MEDIERAFIRALFRDEETHEAPGAPTAPSPPATEPVQESTLKAFTRDLFGR